MQANIYHFTVDVDNFLDCDEWEESLSEIKLFNKDKMSQKRIAQKCYQQLASGQVTWEYLEI